VEKTVGNVCPRCGYESLNIFYEENTGVQLGVNSSKSQESDDYGSSEQLTSREQLDYSYDQEGYTCIQEATRHEPDDYACNNRYYEMYYCR